MSEVETPVSPPPAEPVTTYTKYTSVVLTAERQTEGNYGPGWYLYATIGGVRWNLAHRKLGGFDDDLQEIATPGFKEARAERYARENGKLRTESGPGAK